MRWSVEVLGGNHFAALLRVHLPEIRVDVDSEDSVFISNAAIGSEVSAEEARVRAAAELRHIGAALAVAVSFLPIMGIGRYVKEHATDGAVLGKHAFISVGTAITVMAGGRMKTSVDGVPINPERSSAERAKSLSDVDPEFRQASVLLAEANYDFRQLYVIFEYVRNAICGNAKNWEILVEKGWATKPELVHFRDTANFLHRHRPLPFENPMKSRDARELIRRLMRCWVDDKMPA
ncbi:MAG: hypothetical protein ABL928_01050 [Sphingorhabdus sp.]